jgi:nucleoside-diphosphate-sugar epimerase
MSALIGSTGFVGGHLQKDFEFTHKYNRANISEIQGLNTDLLICAGLPAEKWKANSDPESDWSNMANLAQLISSVNVNKAILISTIDVFQPAVDVTEDSQVTLFAKEAYGRNRAWFELFFKATYSNHLIIRLPGLFAADLKKNFIFDLINAKYDQIHKVDRDSLFQFFDIAKIGEIIRLCEANNLSEFNVATEPVTAQEVAGLFNITLGQSRNQVNYRMKTKNYEIFGGQDGYICSKEAIINGIAKLTHGVHLS